jgi:hypothetical protein
MSSKADQLPLVCGCSTLENAIAFMATALQHIVG